MGELNSRPLAPPSHDASNAWALAWIGPCSTSAPTRSRCTDGGELINADEPPQFVAQTNGDMEMLVTLVASRRQKV